MQNSDHKDRPNRKDVAISRLCKEFEQTLKGLKAGTQANAETLEEGIHKLADAKESFDLKVANAIGHSTDPEFWRSNVFYHELKKRAPERWREVRELRTEAEFLQKELAKQLAQRRLVSVCSDFRENLRRLRDAAQTGTLEAQLSQLENAKQSFELQVANAIAYPTDSESWKQNLFYRELRQRAPQGCEEVRALRTEAKSLHDLIGGRLEVTASQNRPSAHVDSPSASYPSIQNSDHNDVAISRLCKEFEQILKSLKAGTQANVETLEEGIRKLADAKETFDLKVANAVGYPTNSGSWKQNLFYRGLKQRAPSRCEEVRKLRTEAESLLKELAKQVTERRLVEICADFRQQLKRIREGTPEKLRTSEEPPNGPAEAKERFELEVAAVFGYPTHAAFWKSYLFDHRLKKDAPQQWIEVRDLRTEADSLLSSLQKDIGFICTSLSLELDSIRLEDQTKAESMEVCHTNLGIAIDTFTGALGSAIDQEITEAVWQDISQFRTLLLKRIPERVERILVLREQALTTERELAKAESQLLAATFLPQASQPLRDRARIASSVRTEKKIFVEAKQLRPLPGEPSYRVLPADLWMQIAQAAAATVWVDASNEIVFLPPLDRPKLKIITNGSLALPGGRLMAIEAGKALIVRGNIKLEECAAGFVYAGACELGKLTVNGRGCVNIEHLKASEDYAKTRAPQIDVAAGFMLCRKIEWPYPTIDCLQLAYIEWSIAPADPFLGEREYRTSLSAYRERKQRMIKDIYAGTKVLVPRVVARMPSPRQSSAATTSRHRAP
jgi:hypothetical protein